MTRATFDCPKCGNPMMVTHETETTVTFRCIVCGYEVTLKKMFSGA